MKPKIMLKILNNNIRGENKNLFYILGNYLQRLNFISKIHLI